ncbi:hypothetical protein niasHS_012698 [Heterodera schachtii]|uniref:F-box domain-containing protein n=1 Tax=Heterodera schachtii TaxID=97005 RepID=A0ABD2IT77_HETSC
MNRRWICNDVWMDLFPFFDHAQLGLKLALLSPRFNALVDTHFDGKSEFTIWRLITIHESIGPEPKMTVQIDHKWVEFPLPDRPLPNKIRFKDLWIDYIDHSVIEFLRSNKQIFDRSGTNLELSISSNEQPIWDVFTTEIWPVFATNIRHLTFDDRDHLDNLLRRTSPTILADLDQLNAIDIVNLLPDAIDHLDGPNAISAGQALSEWLHTPSKDGQQKRLFCVGFDEEGNFNWVNSFKETFLRAITSVRYQIDFKARAATSIEPFESVNARTKEKLTLDKVSSCDVYWLLKRCPISEKAAAFPWDDDENWDDTLNSVQFDLRGGISSAGHCRHQRKKKKKKRVKASKRRLTRHKSRGIDCAELKDAGFASHSVCYMDCNFCEVCKTNKLALLRAYRLRDFFSLEAIRQVIAVANRCGIVKCLFRNTNE